MHERLINDVAYKTTREVLSVFAPCLRPEELLEAHREVLEKVQAGLKLLLDRRAHELNRLARGEGEEN